jgi:sulfonate transport system substrate-binding protein
MSIDRRRLLHLAGAAALAAGLPGLAVAEAVTEIRIGYQKNGILPVARQLKALEDRFAGQGVDIRWVEFVAGPPLLEAMSAGAIDFGATGDAPPIFAQSAGARIVYAAGQPVTTGQGIVVKGASPIRGAADLKGKRVAFHKGSSAHNVVLATLESVGLTYADITPVFLSPADAGAAFARDSVDAWAIWDPFLAIAERKHATRLIVDGAKIAASNSFFLANKDFASANPKLLSVVVEELGEVARWAEKNRDKVAESLAAITGVEIEAQRIASDRAGYVIVPISDRMVLTQQAIADRFARLNIIPRPIQIRDAVWTAPAS